MASSSYAIACPMLPTRVARDITLQKKAILTQRNASTFILDNVTTKKNSLRVVHAAPLKVTHEPDHGLVTAVKRIKRIMATSKSKEDCNIKELVMIDVLERLGLEYYFRTDINAVLRKHYERWNAMKYGDNLHHTSLRFRLLRQHGYFVTSETFSRFKDTDGRFRKELSNDIKGLLSLFEASHLSIPGDKILDEAYLFCLNSLTNLKNSVKPSEALIIANTLSNPYYKSLPRLSSKNFLHHLGASLKFLHDYNVTKEWVIELEEIARIDIKMAEISHQDEVAQITRWLKELRLSEELKLARNQSAKWHMWSLVSLPAPNMREQRLLLTKAISFVYIIDDLFDVYGTLEELTLFTQAVNNWEYANVEGLPEYMKFYLKALYDTTNEMCHIVYNKHGFNPQYFLQKAWADLCNAFLTETRWFTSGYIPTTKEYMKSATISTGLSVVYAYIVLLLGEPLNHLECTNLLSTYHIIAYRGATILRLWDDLGSAKDENQSGHDGSYITCYMEEYTVNSAESARQHVLELISDEWKCLNETYMSPSSLSSDFKTVFLNLARMVPFMYNYNANQSPSKPTKTEEVGIMCINGNHM